MSPVDPVSPTSPMDISPITPTAMAGRRPFDMPATPFISPSVHLPKLVTSFQNSSTNDALRRMSVQFQLLTPSPLSLRDTPLTAGQQRCSASRHGRAAAQRDKPTSPIPNLMSMYPRTPRDNELPSTSSSVHRKVPSLIRQNANEGLDNMRSYLTEQVVCLPLRSNNGPSVVAVQPSAEAKACYTDQLSKEFQSTAYRRILPKPNAEVGLNASPATGGVKPRSPINKRRHDRRHLASSQPRRIIVRQVQTPQQKHLQSSIAHLGSQLVPLISVRTGKAHPEFPKTLLQYHLLTHHQLDSLARWYHQTIDAGRERWMYPCPIAWGKIWCGSSSSMTAIIDSPSKRQLVDLNTKRRRWGRFIGLRGCDSPVEEQQESITERMERDWKEALRKAEEEHLVREKLWGRQF